MKKHLLLFLLLPLVIFISNCSGTKEITANKINTIYIDGETNDWQRNLNYDDDTKSAYGVSFDGKFVSFVFVTNSEDYIRNIEHNGMIIRINANNYDKMYSIKYPNGRLETGYDNSMMLTDKYDQDKVIIEKDDDSPVQFMNVKADTMNLAVVNYNNNRLVYEIKLPVGSTKIDGFSLPFPEEGELFVKIFIPENERMDGIPPDHKEIKPNYGNDPGRMSMGGYGRGAAPGMPPKKEIKPNSLEVEFNVRL